MGTNYYLKLKPCPTCHHDKETLHIGKSSWGWAFTLHVLPERGILDLPDWVALWAQPGARIEDEYDEVVAPDDMYKIIVIRDKNCRRHDKGGDSHCIKYGAGPWDCILGDFS